MRVNPNDPSYPLFRESEGLRAFQDEMRRYGEIRRSIEAYSLSYSALSRAAEESEKRRAIARDLAQPLRIDLEQFDLMRRAALKAEEQFRAARLFGDSVPDAMARVLGETGSWIRQARSFERELQAQHALERQLRQSALSAFAESFRRTTEFITTGAGAALRPGIASLMLAPTEGFGWYVPAALERAATADDEETRVGAEAGVALAEAQLADAVDLQEELLATPVPEKAAGSAAPASLTETVPSELILAAPRRVELFFVTQEADAVAHASQILGPDGRAMNEVVPMAAGAYARRDLARLIIGCRRDAGLRGFESPFRHSDFVDLFLVDVGFLDPRVPERGA